MKELLPHWDLLDQLAALPASQSQPFLLQVQSGLPYLAVRLALAGRSVFVICSEDRAETFGQDAQSLASLIPEMKDWSVGYLPYQAPQERSALVEDSYHKKGILWSGSMDALLEKSFSRRAFTDRRWQIKVGRSVEHADFIRFLSENGYMRTDSVEETGQFAVRGEVFDFWSPNSEEPVRMVFDHDTVEGMHLFDPGTQRTREFLIETIAVPLTARIPAAAEFSTIADFFPESTIFIVADPRVEEDPALLKQIPSGRSRIITGLAGQPSGLAPCSRIHLNWEMLKKELGTAAQQNIRTFVLTHNMGETHRLEEILDGLRLEPGDWPKILVAPLYEGYSHEDLKISVWSYDDLTGVKTFRRRMPKFKLGRKLESMADIKIGDYVVHEHFGIGRYQGLEKVSLKLRSKTRKSRESEKISEFLALSYKKGDRLLVPINDFRLVQKYVAQEGKKPELYSLDGAAWERVKQKVKKEVEEIAGELLKTAAEREAAGRPIDIESGPQQNMLSEFEEAFPYEETSDQRAAIDAVYSDMDSQKLMDRLVCGDVGYGKTEIAMRAAFKAVSRRLQVAVLVPTTILAEQHYKNFTNRFAAFPVHIAMISRFQTKQEQSKVLADLKAGHVDIIIGTHRLIQKDVSIERLGLLIIDEEHRFGVKQKEMLKKVKASMDVLSLSATPIPRTLSFALGGIRDISIVETPPQGRLPIETQVGLFDEKIVKEAIQRELGRGGQVFYVHNRISSIEKRKEVLEKIVPGLKVGIAHGQMTADGLEKAMWNFLHRKWDVLLATSIIESGLDIPSVNTLIVEDSEEFGLSQLYQLRGRVGRQSEKAYCYLFFSGWSHLSDDARKRLEAIQEFSSLGSGIKLAMRDMEIRGTGNFLGQQQHGWVNAIGLDLYCQMLSEEIEKQRRNRGASKGKTAPRPEPAAPQKPAALPEIELNLPAYIPEDYIQVPGERILIYKKLASVASPESGDQLKAELQDRFGPAPEALQNLYKIIDLKWLARDLKVDRIYESETGIVMSWKVGQDQKDLPINLGGLAGALTDALEVLPPSNETERAISILLIPDDPNKDIFGQIEDFLNRIRKFVIV